MTLGEALDLVLKLAEHTQGKLPANHAALAADAIDYVREFQRGFCIAHTLTQRKETT
jgi:hypothetical protein